mgnify:CR=1 FL=1
MDKGFVNLSCTIHGQTPKGCICGDVIRNGWPLGKHALNCPQHVGQSPQAGNDNKMVDWGSIGGSIEVDESKEICTLCGGFTPGEHKSICKYYKTNFQSPKTTDWKKELEEIVSEYEEVADFHLDAALYGEIQVFIKRLIARRELAMNKKCNKQAEESINQLSRELNKVNKENKMLKADIAYAIGRFKGLNLQCFYLERRYPHLVGKVEG